MITAVIRYSFLGLCVMFLTINNAISQANISAKDESCIKLNVNRE